MIAPTAAAGESAPEPYAYSPAVTTPATDHARLLQWSLATDDAPNLARIVMVDKTLYATSSNGTFHSSSDHAQTWRLLYDFAELGETTSSKGDFLFYSAYWDAMFCSFSGAMTGHLYVSRDCGHTWTISDLVPHRQYLLQDGMGESPDGILYYGQYGVSTYAHGEYLANHAYIRKSTDGGRSWSTETSIYAYHIHSVEVAHDGKVFASYGDAHQIPNTRGMMVKENGVWGNVTSSLMNIAQSYGIARIGDYTYFGSDSYGAPSIMRYDGQDFEASLDRQDSTRRFRFCNNLLAADGVIYAFTFCSDSSPTAGGPLVGYDVWASPDRGDNWYRIQTLTYDQGVRGPIFSSGAVEDGSPYVFALSSSGTDVYRFHHLGEEGISQLMYGEAFAESGSNCTTSITLANSDCTIPLASHWIRDPTISVTAKSLTNVFAKGQFDQLPSVDYNIKPSWIADTSTYTTAPQSLKIDAGGTTDNYISIYVDKSRKYTGMNFLIVFDAKRDSSSGSFLLSGSVNFGGSPIQYSKADSFFALTDEWRTYAFVSDRIAPAGYTNAELILTARNPLENQTANIDNIRAYVLDPDEASVIVPTGHYQASVELPASNVTVTVDGQSYDLWTGPFEDGEVIRTIHLSGDYTDSIDLSAYCDGAVTITVEGERIANADGLIPIRVRDDIRLMGGNTDSYLRLHDTTGVVYGGTRNVISPTARTIYQNAAGDALITPTSLSVSAASPVTVEILDWDVGDARSSASWRAVAPSGEAVTFALSDLPTSSRVTVLVDDVKVASGSASRGTYSFVWSDWSEHVFAVEIDTSIAYSTSVMTKLLGIVMVVAVLGAVFTMVGRIKP